MEEAHPTTFTLREPMLDEPRTYVIFGVSRGGTTMVAGTAHRLGLDIGKDFGHTFEDPRFNLRKLSAAHNTRASRLVSIRGTIRERNHEAEVWGWKFPNAIRYLSETLADLRNPHLILVCRDTAAVIARGSHVGEEPAQALRRTAGMQLQNLRLVESENLPSLVISYERTLHNPIGFVNDFADFIGVQRPTDTAWYESYISPGYKPLKVALTDSVPAVPSG